MEIEKLERDGKVAVLYSPGFGAGWSTWNERHEDLLLFDREIVEAVLANDIDKAMSIAKAKCPNAYVDGAGDGLEVDWLPKGTRFFIHEYDGYESIVIISPDYGYVA